MESKGIALVTGASKGLGRAIALRLADDGFDVAIANRASSKSELDTLSQEISQKGRRTSTIICDVSLEVDVKLMIETTVRDLGGLDVMVANAGVGGKFEAIQDISVEHWDNLISINARGTFLCYKYAAQQMIKQGRGGRIIGASSLVGIQGFAGLSTYCASKFAIRGLSQSAARDLGQHKITVNTVSPGPIKTAMFEDALNQQGDAEAIINQCIQSTSVGYMGTPPDVASLVSYLVSKEAHFITGQNIILDGGVLFN